MIEFKNIDLNFKNLVNNYYIKYGEGSCQHSFASSFCLKNKYNDMFAEKDNVLYICREGISNEHDRVYLFPMCDKTDEFKVKNAILEIIDDAHYYNKKVKFQTITNSSKEILTDLFKDKFEIDDCRDLYEYIFDVEKIASLQGNNYQSKRNIINKLIKTYNNITIKEIEEYDIHELKKVYEEWMGNHKEIDAHIATNEIKEFEIAISNYKELDLIGVCIYIDDKIVGFNFGSIISNDTYDGMVQKGNIKYEGIYELLNRETAKLLKNKIKYMNFEEDLGVSGLRKAKLMYHPEYLLDKYIAKEK